MINLDASPREALIARMQAHYYGNIRQGNLQAANKVAQIVLDLYDVYEYEKPADSMGFWANRCFDLFVDETSTF